MRFTVEGSSRTNERARHGRRKVYTPEKTRAARREIVAAFRDAQTCGGVHKGPVRMVVRVEHASPRPWPGRYCAKKPDLDNVLKLVADALNGVAYFDDQQIVEMRAEKAFAESSALHVILSFEAEEPEPKDGLEKVGPKLWRLWNQGSHGGWVIQSKSRGPESYAISHQLAEPKGLAFHLAGYAGTQAEAIAKLRD